MSVRFSGVVYPGDTIITDMWDEGKGKILVQARTQEGRVAISNALVEVKS
jgi:acyl dehydratase